MSRDATLLHLKVRLAAHGVGFAGDNGDVPRGDMIDLTLPSGVPVAALVHPEPGASPFRLVETGSHAFIETDAPSNVSTRVPVRTATVPSFYEQRTSSGRRMRDVAVMRGRGLLVTPGGGCGFSTHGSPCAFCTEGGQGGAVPPSPVDVMETVSAARRERLVDFVLLNSAAFDLDDGGLQFLAPYVQTIRRHVDTLLAVQMHPPRVRQWVDRTYALGVDALSYSVEIFDPDTCSRQCIGRARYIGRDRYLEMLRHAAAVFPAGTVWSELVTGVEPAASTLAGIDALVDMGVVPVVSMRHAGAVGGDPAAPAPLDELTTVLRHLFSATQARGLNTGWIHDLALAITPLEARHAAGEAAGLVRMWQGWMTRSRPGILATRSLSRLRRRLRVRTGAGEGSPH